MVSALIKNFGGMLPTADDHLLPDQYAAEARDTWLVHGTLIGLPLLNPIHNNASSLIGAVYRLPLSYSNPTYMYSSSWLEFTDRNTNVIHAPVFGDTFDRYYWASPSDVPRYNTRARIDAGNTGASAPWKLGITVPTVLPGVSAAGGVGIAESRAYVYTWVSAYGEEGAPSPPKVVNGKVDDTWSITMTAAVTADLGGTGADRNLTKVRIYRTVTDSSGTATFYLVAEQAIGTLSYSDTALSATITGNAILASTYWTPPPTDLLGWQLMPNGSIAAFRANEVWFSEPFRPHAWPPQYVQTVEYGIVGLGITAQTLIVCTKGYPVAMFGNNPATTAASKLTSFEPCNSRLSIISAPEGVYYASPNGLVLAAGGVANVITSQSISKDKWNKLTNFSSIYAARFGSAYYAPGSGSSSAFYASAFDPSSFSQQDYAGALNGVLIDPSDQLAAVVHLTSPIPTDSVQTDPWSGELLVIRGGVVYWLDVAYAVTGFNPYLWRSKIYTLPTAENLGAVAVYFNIPLGSPTLVAPNTNLVQTLAANQYGLMRVYADGRLVSTQELRTSGLALRLPSGFKASTYQFEFEARVEITSVQFASTVKGLGKEPYYYGNMLK